MGTLKYEAKEFEGKSNTAVPSSNYNTVLNAYREESQSTSNYIDITGINANKIDEMNQSIEDYIKMVNTNVDSVLNEITFDDAFASEEFIEEIRKFNTAVKDATVNYFSYLRKFEDLLSQIKANYEAQNTGMAQNLSSESSSTQKLVEEYKPAGSTN